MTPESLNLTIDRLEEQGIYAKIRATADAEVDKISSRRRISREAYRREPLPGDEDAEGRSQYQDAAVFMQVESTWPGLMGRVLATDHRIRVKGPAPMVAKALLTKCRETIQSQEKGAFYTYACAIKDGLMSITGTVKLFWSRTFKKVKEVREVDATRKALLEQMRDAGEIQHLEIEELPAERAVYDPGDGITPPMEVAGPVAYRATVTLSELEKSGAVVMPLPPEQFISERGKAHINDGRGCGHQVTMTVGELLAMQERLSTPDEPFFDKAALERAVKQAAKTTPDGGALEQERRSREEESHVPSTDVRLDFGLTASDLRKPITVTEWADSVVAGGKVQRAILWFAGAVLLACKKNTEGIVPFCCWSPFFLPHSLHGMGVAEVHVVDQDTGTAFGRAAIEYLGRLVDEETYILNENTDVASLRRRRAGQVVYAKPGVDFVRRGVEGTLDSKLLQAKEWLKTDGQDVGPANRWTLGGNVDPRNTTATGQEIMSRASSVRQNMIALVFTEMFQVDLYNKLIRLLQENADLFTVEVDGEVIELTRDDIQGDYTAYSEVGREFDVNNDELRRRQMILDLVGTLYGKVPWVTDVHFYNAVRQVLLAGGEPVISDYAANPAQMAPPPRALPPAPPGALPPGQVPPGAAAGLLPNQPDRAFGHQAIDANAGGL